jgi:hypothetical protein
MSLPGRLLPAAAIVTIVGLVLFGVYSLMGVNTKYSYVATSTKGAAQPIIPVWDPGEEDSSAGQSDDTPPLLPTLTQSPLSDETETPTDQWASEHMEAASKEPLAEGLKGSNGSAERDNLPRGNFSNQASRPADFTPSDGGFPLPEDTTTPFQDFTQPLTDEYTNATPPPTPPPDSSTATETPPQPPTEVTVPFQTPFGSWPFNRGPGGP